MMKLTACLAVALGFGPRLWAAPLSTPLALPQPAREAATAHADAPTGSKPTGSKPAGSVLMSGKVEAISRPPKPGSVPYKDAVIAIRLADVRAPGGKLAHKEILVFLWGMRDDKWTPAAAYKLGQAITLSLIPWDEVADRYGAYNRIELEGDDVFELEPFWGEPAPIQKPAQKPAQKPTRKS